VTTKPEETVATISIDDLRTVSNQIDTEFTQTFAGVFAQHRTWRKATDYTETLTACDTPVKTCWDLAEKAGHDTPGPFQSLIAENQWDHNEIWNRIATRAPRLLPCPTGDPLGPGIAVDETAQLTRGHHTVGIGTQWAGCVGRKAHCVTSVFLSYVTPQAATWIAHGLFLPKKDWFTGDGATGQARRTAVGVPEETVFQTKPQIARRKFQELRDLGVRVPWASGDEVYGRYAALRADHEKNGEAYAYFVPRDFRVPTSTAGRCRADDLARHAQGHGEVRSVGPGRTGPQWYEWAMVETGSPQHVLLIRRPWPRPGTPTADSEPTTTSATTSTRDTDTDSLEKTSFVYCYVPKDSGIRPTLSNLVMMAGRRWPVEETIASGKGPLGWDHNQYRTWTSVQHHTALCGLAMLKTNALRARLENTYASSTQTDHPEIDHPEIKARSVEETSPYPSSSPQQISGRSLDLCDDLMIPLGDGCGSPGGRSTSR
jgi:SRSO17 transposase